MGGNRWVGALVRSKLVCPPVTVHGRHRRRRGRGWQQPRRRGASLQLRGHVVEAAAAAARRGGGGGRYARAHGRRYSQQGRGNPASLLARRHRGVNGRGSSNRGRRRHDWLVLQLDLARQKVRRSCQLLLLLLLMLLNGPQLECGLAAVGGGGVAGGVGHGCGLREGGSWGGCGGGCGGGQCSGCHGGVADVAVDAAAAEDSSSSGSGLGLCFKVSFMEFHARRERKEKEQDGMVGMEETNTRNAADVAYIGGAMTEDFIKRRAIII